MKSKPLFLYFAFGTFLYFFVGQSKVNQTILIQKMRKDDKWNFCVINKIALTQWVISNPQKRALWKQNYAAFNYYKQI